MTQSQVEAAIKARLATQWAALHATVPLQLPNELRQEIVVPYGHVSIAFGAARIAALGGAGNNVQRQSGDVIIRLFVETGGGTDVLNGLADDAAAILRTWVSGELRFFESAPVTADFDTPSGANLFQKDVIASFDFDLTT